MSTDREATMSAAEADIFLDTEKTRVISWRLDALLAAGYSWGGAMRLAVELDVDLHRATDLRDRGCDENLALRILL